MDVGEDHDGEGDEMREAAASGNKVQLRHLPHTTAEEEKVGISIGSSTTTRKEGQHADDSTYFPPLDSGKALFCLGKFLHKKEFNDDAMSFYRYALFLLLQELEISEPSLLDDSMDCSGFFYVDVAEVGKTACTPAHQDLAHLLTKMGDVHGKFMEVNDAMHAYRAAQVFWTRFLADHEIHSIVDCETTDDMDLLDEYADAVEGLALTHNRIGGVYCTRGELNLALNSFHEALDLQVDVLGPSHLEVAKTLHNIGVAHRHNNELDEALDYYTKAHRIFEQNLGRDNLDTVRTLHNIGGVYRRRKEYEKALSCFREVIKVRRSLLGDGHPSVSITLVSMAAVLRRSGKAEEANKFYAAAMK
jgi:tetratricopeptide (TPR) repeat protein